MGEVNFIPGTVKAVDQVAAIVEIPFGTVGLPIASFTVSAPAAGHAVTLCIRPEHFRRAGDAEGPTVSLGQAEVTGSAFFGTHYRCHLKPAGAADMSIVAHMPQSADVADGQIMPLAVTLADIVALPSGGR
nr:TOBE domain-containing protein [Pararhizobium polonicum]